jgi:hypothetical protein
MVDGKIPQTKKCARGAAIAALFASAVLAATLAAGCGKGPQPAAEVKAPETFASPDAAGKAVYDACKASDTNALLTVFGSNGKEIVSSGDPVHDQSNLKNFVTAYDQMHRLDPLKDGAQILTIGAENYPFPVPLVKNSSGQWYFDTDSAKGEILARRVGQNELDTMDALYAMSDAQDEYYSQLHDGSTVQQYAQKFVSDPGKHNGLVWNVAEGEPESPLGPLAAKASADGYTSSAEPYHGYFYRILTKQGEYAEGGAQDFIVNGNMTGGYAILAFPAEYRNSGVMTFIITDEGAIYQKDLGADTATAAKAIDAVNLDSSWKLVGDDQQQ